VARRPREDVPGSIHHAIAKGNAGIAIVADDHDREQFVSRLGRTVMHHGWACLAYCLLDTHVHLLIGTPRGNLSAGMQSLLGPYAQNFNLRHDREGHLFRARFYSKRIRSQYHLVAAIIYIALNPVRAGLTARPEAWRWGSYPATVGRQPAPRFLDVRATLELVHPDPESARTLLHVATLDALDR
jgi:putative transposase